MISKKTFQKLLKNGLTIAFAESMTGGLCAFEMIKNEGASNVIKGSLITYSDAQKIKWLDIKADEIKAHGVVSKEIAQQMAKQVRMLTDAHVGVSVTGYASLKSQTETQRLEAFIGIETKDLTDVYHIHLEGFSRLQAIKKTVRFVYEKLDEILSKNTQ